MDISRESSSVSTTRFRPVNKPSKITLRGQRGQIGEKGKFKSDTGFPQRLFDDSTRLTHGNMKREDFFKDPDEWIQERKTLTLLPYDPESYWRLENIAKVYFNNDIEKAKKWFYTGNKVQLTSQKK